MAMPSPLAMTDDELATHFEAVCRMLAVEYFRTEHPNADQAAADLYADRHWQAFKSLALDFLALAEADRGAREAAPQN